MSSTWEPCGKNCGLGDIIRWTEAVWHDSNRRRRKRKALKLGDRTVLAQIVEELDNDFVRLEVLECSVKAGRYAVELEPYKKHETIRRKRSTLLRNGERMISKAGAHPRLPASKFINRES